MWVRFLGKKVINQTLPIHLLPCTKQATTTHTKHSRCISFHAPNKLFKHTPNTQVPTPKRTKQNEHATLIGNKNREHIQIMIYQKTQLNNNSGQS